MAKLDKINIDGVLYDIEDAGAYRKPQGGIPSSDLEGGIPKSKLDSSVQNSLSNADAAAAQIFDISAYHATGDVLAKYADLTAALGTNGANIPDALRKGGMSVKFVQSSDNKYIQARLMADEFTTDTTQWAIAEEGVYIDNPEFVYVKTDNEDKILYGVKKDGEFFFGVGCP